MEKEKRDCPYCGEEIFAIARKCKHCGEWLTEKEQLHELPVKEITKPRQIHAEAPLAKQHYGFFEYYFFDVFIRHYADFKGKISRKQFWIGYLCYTLFMAILACIDFVTGWMFISILTGSLLFVIPGIAVVIRRLHDTGKSGWWFMIQYVPIVGFIWLFVLLCRKGETRIAPVVFRWPDYIACAAVVLAAAFSIYFSSRDIKTHNQLASTQTTSIKASNTEKKVSDETETIINADNDYISDEPELVNEEDFDFIATYDDEKRHCTYFTKKSDKNILYKYDLKTEEILPIDLTQIVCIGETEPPMIYSVSQIVAKDHRLIIIANNGGCGMFAGEYLIVYNSFNEGFTNVDFGYVDLLKNNTRAKVTHKKLIKEGSCSAENEYEYTHVIYEL